MGAEPQLEMLLDFRILLVRNMFLNFFRIFRFRVISTAIETNLETQKTTKNRSALDQSKKPLSRNQ